MIINYAFAEKQQRRFLTATVRSDRQERDYLEFTLSDQSGEIFAKRQTPTDEKMVSPWNKRDTFSLQSQDKESLIERKKADIGLFRWSATGCCACAFSLIYR